MDSNPTVGREAMTPPSVEEYIDVLPPAIADIIAKAAQWMKDGIHIGVVRRRLFVSWDSPWNAWIRDMTADLESQAMTPDSESQP